ncbi:MAG: DNA topoisomerase 3 [Thiohalocapsa sp.]|jgi:DNA topoisomerase-3|uniref:type IA DNA topoisomerase n=1 Tax=Thiohalocapsa sp. TaxID=2497641 RepID=UPI0025E3F4B4|nr:type IA DNA topoisomerase [Thiohalocapsa sp.]MCG6941249.1 DNA topoisomerase 3 [Thiohalocapsa sp.]
MTTVVVAEKPSVARDIAAVLGASGRGEGCLRGNGWCITWALGHLVHFAEPDDYGADWAGRWSPAQLPMIPERWRLRTDKKTSAQFRIVKALLTAADTERVVCATDAGREGELIFRLIVEHARCRKPVERLWISSLTTEAIRAGFAALRPAADYEPLAAAARARAQADWLVGMNLTRAYTVHNRVLCTIGRVQTPTLAMIVARDAAIANFTKAYFYELIARLKEGFEAKYSKDGETRIDDKAHAERLQRQIDAAIEPHRTGTVTSVQKKVRHNRPPPLYDLTNLQRDANRRFGFTAARVLELAQALYETHKLISYPRTESRHIGEDMLSELPGILEHVEHPLAAEARARLAAGHRLGKAYVDKTKLTDHHAILPTARRPPAGLPEPLRKIYDLVAARFVAVFLPDQRVEETLVTLDIGGEPFIAKGSVELEPGWKRVEPRRRAAAGGSAGGEAGADARQGPGGNGEAAPAEPATAPDTAADQHPLPPLEKGQIVHVDALDVVERETKPPRPFDDATLLNAMKHAGRDIDDDALAAAMKSSGLGTPATRAEIIEKLLRTGYIERQRKQLRATDKGKALIALVAEPLRSVELTAAWEQWLKDIEQGAADAEGFYRDICDQVRALIPQVAAGPAMTPEQAAAARTAAPKRAGGKGRGTKRGGSSRGKSRSSSEARANAAGLGTCPVCKQGEIIETPRAYGCARWRDGCGFTIWKTIAGHALTKEEVTQLMAQGRTGPIDGFRSKAGKPFAACLRLDDNGKVGLDFADRQPGASADAAAHAAPPPGLADHPPSAASLRENPLVCPQCGAGRIIEGRYAFGCNRWREGCDFRVPKEHDGHRLSESELRALVEQHPRHGAAGEE